MGRDYPLGLVMATEHEARPFIHLEGLRRIEVKPFAVYEGKRFRLIIAGIGKANAAMGTGYLTWKYGHDDLYNIGAAGSTGNGVSVGDIFHIDKILEMDRPGVLSKKMRFLTPDLLEGHAAASLCTQDHPVIDPAERERIRPYAFLVDMEGASFIQACRLFGSRGYLFKIVTDTPDHRTDRDIITNIEHTRQSLYEYMCLNVLKEDPAVIPPQ